MVDLNYDKKDKQSRVPKEDERYRSFIFILYPDSTSYDYEEVINTIKGEFKFYVFITHLPEQEEKKVHTHVLVTFSNPRYASTVANKLGIDLSIINLPISKRGYVRYMIHLDYPDKKQYSLTDLTVSKSYTKQVYEYFNDEKLDIEILEDIYSFIDDRTDLSAIELEKQLSLYVCSASYNRIFKMYYQTIIKYICNKV